RADDFFEDVGRWYARNEPANHRLLTPDLFATDLADALDELGHDVLRLGEKEESKEKALELTARGARCSGIAAELRALVGLEREGHVYWVEEDGESGRRNLAIVSAPVDVSSDLHEHLWSGLKSATLTSATLTAGGDEGFAHVAERLGVREERRL